MPYYSAGDYYRGYAAGDNYQAGGLFSFVGKAAKALFRASPLGAVASALVPGISGPPQPLMPLPGLLRPGQVKEPGITGIVHRAAPGGHTGLGRYTKQGTFTERRRPRMDVGNIKALKRADRRAHGFLKVYSRVVRHFIAKPKPGKAYVHFKKKK